jgi:hypothetical protein
LTGFALHWWTAIADAHKFKELSRAEGLMTESERSSIVDLLAAQPSPVKNLLDRARKLVLVTTPN